jgi:hypothetical protein
MMFRWIEASVSCSKLSTMVTYEHIESTTSSTHLQLIDGGEALGGSGKYSPDTPGLTVLDDLGAGAASPWAALPGTPASVPHTIKSCNKLLALSPSQGPGSATSVPVAPCGAPPALDTSIPNVTTDHQWATRIDEA